MNTRAWDTSTVREVGMVVRVNGTIRPHTTVTWGQDLVSALPAQVTANGGFAQRVGTIVWFTAGASVDLPSPWNEGGGWVPGIGDDVTVDALDGLGNTIRVFTGRIDTVSGGSSGDMVSKIVDRIDDFNKIARVGATSNYGMEWEQGYVRRLAPTSAWVIDDVARQCGYYATPPAPPGVILDAPLQGTTYVYAEPSAGKSNAQLIHSRSLTEDTNPRWKDGGGGDLALGDAHLIWRPYSANPGGATTAVRFSLLVHPNHKASTRLAIRKAGGDVSLTVTGTRRVWVDGFSAFQIPASETPVVVSVILRGGTVDVATSTGQAASTSRATPSGTISMIEMRSELGAAISGVQVSDPGTAGGHVAVSWKRTMKISYGWHAYWQECAPSIRDEIARDVFSEFAEAMLTPMWLDGDGVLQCIHSDHLVRQPHAVTVSTRSNARDLSWKLDFRDLRDPVHVHWSDPSIRQNRNNRDRNVTVYEGNGGSLANGASVEGFWEIPEDEEWLNLLDLAGTNYEQTGNMGMIHIRRFLDGHGNPSDAALYEKFKAGVGSYWGAVVTRTETYFRITGQNNDGSPKITLDTRDYEQPADAFNYTIERINPWKWRYTALANADVVQRTPDNEDSKVPVHLRGIGLPVIRAGGHVKRVDRVYTRENKARRWLSLEHHMGRWCTTTAIAEKFGDFLYEQLTGIHPVVEGLVCRFDPRIEVGAVIQVAAQDLHGVALRGLVTSVEHNPAEDTTTPTLRIIEATTDTVSSFNELRTAWPGATYATLAAAWATINGTYADLSADSTWKG